MRSISESEVARKACLLWSGNADAGNAAARHRPPPGSADLALGVAQTTLDRQLSFIDAVTTKTNSRAAAGLTLAAIYTAVVKLPSRTPMAATGLLYGVIALGMLLAVLALLATKGGRYETGPSVADLRELQRGNSVRKTGWAAVDVVEHCIRSNRPEQDAQVWALRWCTGLAAVETACVLAGLLVVGA